MKNKHWLGLNLAGFLWAAFLGAPGLPLPGADHDFKPKAKLKNTFNSDVPKGWGPSAKGAGTTTRVRAKPPRALVDRVAQINSRRATVI
jgi:hypothetical protein